MIHGAMGNGAHSQALHSSWPNMKPSFDKALRYLSGEILDAKLSLDNQQSAMADPALRLSFCVAFSYSYSLFYLRMKILCYCLLKLKRYSLLLTPH
jgi:hypothetical protein